jgi:hypothetical protein
MLELDVAGPGEILAAGGLVPVDSVVPGDAPVDTVDAVAFTHPAIPGRTVVRLIPDAVARGVVVEMELLGFAHAGKADDIAKMRRRTPGFPGVTLIRDPENARYALDVMKDFKATARRIASKPGDAKDGFVEIATRLARQVPHFLPPFWEEVGRAFVEAGNLAYGGQAFEKARLAERQHGLAVDEQTRADAFLEFALAGALAVKSLQAYAKELQADVGAADAYERFLDLAIKRTKGGLAPWASLPKDLRGLAKAAKRDGDVEDQRFLAEVLDSAGVHRAPAGFWTSYRDALVRLARSNPKVRGRVLDLFPKPSTGDVEDDWWDIVVACGAEAALFGDVPAEAMPAGSRAAWFGRANAWWADRRVLYPVLRKMAPLLRSEGVPVRFADPEEWEEIELDLLDLALELGVLVADPGEYTRFDANDWAAVEAADGEARPRDPTFVAADPRFKSKLDIAIAHAIGREQFEKAARGKSALIAARRRTFEAWIAALDNGGLAATADALESLEDSTSPATFGEFPDLLPKLQAADVQRVLARTLRAGVFDEWGWDAFEAAVAELSGKDLEVSVESFFPVALVWNEHRAIALDGSGRRFAHDFKLPKGKEVRTIAYSDGQLLVVWWDGGNKAYWSGRPNDELTIENLVWKRAHGLSLPVPGGVCEGEAAVHPGDTKFANRPTLFSDGTAFWTVEGDPEALRTLDPVTGAVGAGPLPAFLAAPDVELDHASLYPLPAGVGRGPLGTSLAHAALYGFRSRIVGDERICERIDGATRRGSTTGAVDALVGFPFSDGVHPLTAESSRWRGPNDQLTIGAADGDWQLADLSNERHRAGWKAVPLLPMWHYLSPRDPAGSRALREVADDVVTALLAGGRADLADEDEEGRAVRAVVAERLPSITHPRLVDGIVGIVGLTAEYAHQLAELVADRDPGAAPRAAARRDDDVSDSDIKDALSALYRSWYASGEIGQAVRTASAFFGGDDELEPVESDLPWTEWIGRIGAVAWLAVAPGTADEDRDVILRFLEAWASSRFAEPGPALRTVELEFDTLDSPWLKVEVEDGDKLLADRWLAADGDHRWICEGEDQYSAPYTVTALEQAGADGFGTPPGARVVRERRITAPDRDRAWIGRFVAAARAHGGLPADEAALTQIAERTGLSRSEALLLYAGLPKINQYQADFLGKELRERLSIKMGDAKVAKPSLRGIDHESRLALYAAVPADDVEALWRDPTAPDGPATRLADAWLAKFGARVPIPEDLAGAAAKELDSPEGVLVGIAAPGTCAALNTDGKWKVTANASLSRDDGDDEEGEVFTIDTATAFGAGIAWAFAALPVGDPLRANLPAVHDRLLARLASPGLLVELVDWFADGAREEKALEAAFQGMGGVPVAYESDDPDEAPPEGRDAGLIVAAKNGTNLMIAFRPARLGDDRGELDRLAGLGGEGDEHSPADVARFVLSDGLRAMMRRVTETPVEPGRFEQDPRASAAALVKTAAKKLGIDADAAALYLQLLALPNPTKKNVLRWNDWKAADYSTATDALVSEGLVVEARRQRAGREHFLPGGWLDVKAPNLPIEAWKLPMFASRLSREGEPILPLGQILLPVAPHAMYARAWARVEAGDAPAFEKVKR